MEFEWDASKEAENIKKHGITFGEAVECFLDLNGFSLRDTKHSASETRYYHIARHPSGKVYTIWYTRRGERIRIIGCAEWRKFRRLYNERTKTK